MKISTETHAYGSHDRQQVTLHYAAQPPARRQPGVLMVHGGYWARESGMGEWPQYLASRGYVVIRVRYRLNSDALWPAQREDVRDGLEWVRLRAAKWNLDPERVAALGSSAGGHLAGQLAVIGAPLAGVVALSPPMSPYRAYNEGLDALGPWAEKKAKLRHEARKMIGCEPERGTPCWDQWVDSVVYQHATGQAPPLWLAHFEEDLVPAVHSEDVMKHLTQEGVAKGDVSVTEVSGTGHGMSLLKVERVRCGVESFLAQCTRL